MWKKGVALITNDKTNKVDFSLDPKTCCNRTVATKLLGPYNDPKLSCQENIHFIHHN